MSERAPDIYPVLSYKDARAGLDFLKNTLGFESLAEHSNEDGEVYHAELRYGDGIIMVSGNRQPDSANPWSEAKFGTYVVVEDVDAHFERARAGEPEWCTRRMILRLFHTCYEALTQSLHPFNTTASVNV